MFRRVWAILFIWGLFTAPIFIIVPKSFASSACDGVKISEIMPYPQSDSEWIELENTTNSPKDISSCFLADSSEIKSHKYDIPANTILQPGGYLVFYRNFYLNNDLDEVRFISENGEVLDTASYSLPATLGAGFSFVFVESLKSWQPTSTPRPEEPNLYTPTTSGEEEDESEDVPYNDCSGIMITEIMPSPTGSDTENEWIEVYNSTGESMDLGGCALSDKLKEGSTKKYVIPMNTVIASAKYLLFRRPVTKITLNNDSDGVVFMSSDESIVSDTGNYNDARENISYAYHEGQWYWTSSPTPEADNVITEPPAKTAKKAASTKKKSVAKPPKSTKKSASNSKKKSSGSGTDVLGARTGDESATKAKINDKMMGYILVVLAGALLMGYLVYINKDFILENTLKKLPKK